MVAPYLIEPNTADSHQTSSKWLAVVVRFGVFSTVDHEKVLASAAVHIVNPDISKTPGIGDENPIAEREPLVLSSEIVEWSINESKSSPMSSAVFRLAPTKDFTRGIRAGDWVLFWAFDNEEDFVKIKRNIDLVLSGKDGVTNDFKSGLKFVGRCNAPKRDTSADPGSGMVRTFYELTCVAYNEFNTSVYYTPAFSAIISNLQASVPAVFAILTEKMAELADIPFTTTAFAVLWLDMFLGNGPSQKSKSHTLTIIADGKPTGDETAINFTPNDVYLIPATVAALLGVEVKGKTENFTYNDMLQRFIDVQAEPNGPYSPEEDMRPVPVPGISLSGVFFMSSYMFDTNVWNLLQSFSNTPINEIYTCLKPGKDMRLRPTFMLRQSPYSSRYLADNLGRANPESADPSFGVVAFAKLPRWLLSPKLVQRSRVGPSDSLRVNYVGITGADSPAPNVLDKTARDMLVSPPIADGIDIKRNGLRKKIQQLNSVTVPLNEKTAAQPMARGGTYLSFMADIMFNQHLKWNGTITAQGIQLPVTIGDNIEYEDVIYQIEAVSHSGGIEPSGRVRWSTTFQVSNGIAEVSDSREVGRDVYPHEVEPAEGPEKIGSGDSSRNVNFENSEE